MLLSMTAKKSLAHEVFQDIVSSVAPSDAPASFDADETLKEVNKLSTFVFEEFFRHKCIDEASHKSTVDLFGKHLHALVKSQQKKQRKKPNISEKERLRRANQARKNFGHTVKKKTK